MTGINKLTAQMVGLSATEVDSVADQLGGVLASLPADESSHTDDRIRHGLEMFLAGYGMGASGRAGDRT